MKLPIQLFLALLLGLTAFAAMAKAPLNEPQKIEALISSIENLKGAVFIRNGSEYSAKQAAAHVRMKWDSAGSKVKTADDFITYCASESSFSGKKYQIRFADGKTVYSEDYLREQLNRISPPQTASSH